MKKTDKQLKQDIEAELLWDPKVNAAEIGVSVDKGTVSLFGTVDTYAEKLAAEKATKRVCGVHAVAEELNVRLLGEHQHTDAEIAAAALTALRWNVLVPRTTMVSVRNGALTLEGQVTWNYQREAAGRAVRYLSGVVAVSNLMTLKPQASVPEVKKGIEAALQRQAAADASSIHIQASGSIVTLTGSASSWQSIEDAAHAAWAAPGVTDVVDQVKHVMTSSP